MWAADLLVEDLSDLVLVSLCLSAMMCVTNINRQLHATSKTGQVKVEVCVIDPEINPSAEVEQ